MGTVHRGNENVLFFVIFRRFSSKFMFSAVQKQKYYLYMIYKVQVKLTIRLASQNNSLPLPSSSAINCL